MKNATVRDLRYHFSRVEHLLRDGESVQITKRKRVIATLVPALLHSAFLRERPDFLRRLKRLYGDRLSKRTGAEQVADERDRY